MMLDKIARYISRQEEIQMIKVNPSGSRYFKVGSVKIRLSDHFSITILPPKTLNIVCGAKDSFVVVYGNKIVPIKDYPHLRQWLRNFIMMADILKPLVKESSEMKTPSTTQNDSNYIFVGDLSVKQLKGLNKTIDIYRKQNGSK